MKNLLSLIPWLVLCYAAAAIGAFATTDAPAFYAALNKPDWAPPATVFGPVWTVLYGLMAISAWLVWQMRSQAPNKTNRALVLFGIQLVVNALWSWLFFAWRNGALAMTDIVVLWILILITIISFYRLHKVAGLLLLPYFAWVTFAKILTGSLWWRNLEVL